MGQPLTGRFSLVGYSITDEILILMLNLINCLPDYVQRIGDMLLDISKDKLSENSTTYPDIVVASAKFSKLSLIACDTGISVTSLYYYMPYLINIEIIERVKKGQYQLIDPIFRDWVWNKFRLV